MGLVGAARPVPGRWTAGLVALVGVLASLPSLVWPTWVQTVGDRERGELLSGQEQWSWGRVELSGLTGVELSTVPNPVGLVVALLLTLLAAVGVAAWVLGRGAVAVVGTCTAALLAGRLLTTAGERHGRIFREEFGSEAGLTITSSTTVAGWLETVSVVALVAALVLMARRLWRETQVAPLVGGDAGDGDDGVPEASMPDRSGQAPRPTRPARGARAGLRPDGAHLDGPEVGLSDDR